MGIIVITVTLEGGEEADGVEVRTGDEIEITGSAGCGAFFFANQGWLSASSAVILSDAFLLSIRLIRSLATKELALLWQQHKKT